MVDFSAIAGVSSSLKATSDIAKAMLGIRDELLIREKVIELTDAIMSAQASAIAAQASHAALIERIRELESQIMEVDNWNTEKTRYQLTEVMGGVFAYAIRPGMEAGEPSHKICANCYQQRRKGLLQKEIRRPNWTEWLVCLDCKSEICTVVVQDPAYRAVLDGIERS